MSKVYKLAIEREFSIEPFGPYMTLTQAEGYQHQMVKAGKKVLIVNAMTLSEKV